MIHHITTICKIIKVTPLLHSAAFLSSSIIFSLLITPFKMIALIFPFSISLIKNKILSNPRKLLFLILFLILLLQNIELLGRIKFSFTAKIHTYLWSKYQSSSICYLYWGWILLSWVIFCKFKSLIFLFSSSLWIQYFDLNGWKFQFFLCNIFFYLS